MREIELTQGKIALVDDSDYDFLTQFKWHARKTKRSRVWYASRVEKDILGNIRTIGMHHQIMNTTEIVDHINQEGLDNQRHNLRIVTHLQNIWNKRPDLNSISQYKGVNYVRHCNSWSANIKYKGQHHYLGIFKSEKDAAKAYDFKADQLFGEYAYLNFPDEELIEMPNPGEASRRGPNQGISKYKGVTVIKGSSKWRAFIFTEGVSKYIGCYNTEEEAALAYDNMAKEIHGDKDIYLNFPGGKEECFKILGFEQMGFL